MTAWCQRCGAPIDSGARLCDPCAAETQSLSPGAALEASVHEFSVGERVLGAFTLRSKLGEGGMGTVFLADDLELNRRVAIKVLSASLCRNPQAVARFEREARLTAALEHPNIVPIFRVGTHEGRPLMVMKLLDGATLAQWAARLGHRPSWSELEPLVVQLADALTFLHGRGMVHRDVKPGNVTVSSTGHVTLLDFGILKEMTGEKTSGAILGTPPYMAPEQILQGTIDARVDLYALAATIYFLLEGKPPFSDHVDPLHAKLSLDRPTAEPVSIPRAPLAVLRRALERVPEQRYPDVASFVAAMRAAWREAPTQPRARKWGAVVAGVGALLAILLGAVGLNARRDADSRAAATTREAGGETPKPGSGRVGEEAPGAALGGEGGAGSKTGSGRGAEAAPGVALGGEGGAGSKPGSGAALGGEGGAAGTPGGADAIVEAGAARGGPPAQPDGAHLADAGAPQAGPSEANAGARGTPAARSVEKVRVSLSVTLDGRTTWAEGFIDGKPVGELPVQVSLAPGSHHLKLVRAGVPSLTTSFKVGGGRPNTLRFELGKR